MAVTTGTTEVIVGIMVETTADITVAMVDTTVAMVDTTVDITERWKSTICVGWSGSASSTCRAFPKKLKSPPTDR